MNAALLPASILVRIATLEQAAVALTTKLETARKELQRLRLEHRKQ